MMPDHSDEPQAQENMEVRAKEDHEHDAADKHKQQKGSAETTSADTQHSQPKQQPCTAFVRRVSSTPRKGASSESSSFGLLGAFPSISSSRCVLDTSAMPEWAQEAFEQARTLTNLQHPLEDTEGIVPNTVRLAIEVLKSVSLHCRHCSLVKNRSKHSELKSVGVGTSDLNDSMQKSLLKLTSISGSAGSSGGPPKKQVGLSLLKMNSMKPSIHTNSSVVSILKTKDHEHSVGTSSTGMNSTGTSGIGTSGTGYSLLSKKVVDTPTAGSAVLLVTTSRNLSKEPKANIIGMSDLPPNKGGVSIPAGIHAPASKSEAGQASLSKTTSAATKTLSLHCTDCGLVSKDDAKDAGERIQLLVSNSSFKHSRVSSAMLAATKISRKRTRTAARASHKGTGPPLKVARKGSRPAVKISHKGPRPLSLKLSACPDKAEANEHEPASPAGSDGSISPLLSVTFDTTRCQASDKSAAHAESAGKPSSRKAAERKQGGSDNGKGLGDNSEDTGESDHKGHGYAKAGCKGLDEYKPYWCRMCGSRFSFSRELKRHRRNEHRNVLYPPGKYVCNVCGRDCHSRNNLHRHMGRHDASLKVVCERCGAVFSSQPSLQKHHIYVHKEEYECKYTCEHCAESFPTLETLTRHKRVYKTGRPCRSFPIPKKPKMGPTACTICGRKFNDNCALKRHMGVHNESLKVVCERCGQLFACRQNLRQHHQFAHKDEYECNFTCEHCSEKFPTKTALQRHLTTGEDKSRLCRSFPITKPKPSNADLIALPPKKAFPCELCGTVMRTEQKLKRHMGYHTGALPFKCNLCGLAYETSARLEVHLKTHRTDREIHQCEECEAAFYEKRSLLHHCMLHHSAAAPYTCNVCHKGFPFESSLRQHMKYCSATQ